jgi:hypothetical protein
LYYFFKKISDFKLAISIGNFQNYLKRLKDVFFLILLFGETEYKQSIYLQLQIYEFLQEKNKIKKNYLEIYKTLHDIFKYFNEEHGEIYLSVLSRAISRTSDSFSDRFEFFQKKYKLSYQYLENNKEFKDTFQIQTSYSTFLSNMNQTEKELIEINVSFFENLQSEIENSSLEIFEKISKQKKISLNNKIEFVEFLPKIELNKTEFINKVNKLFQNNEKYFSD